VTVLALDADSLADADERARVAADVERLNRMVDEVIHEARRPVREGVRASCDAVAVVRGRAEFWRVLAEDQARALTVSLPPGPRMVRCDDVDLSEALDALINNVFHHTEEGAALAVTMTAEGVGTLLVVEDGGAGLPETAVVARGASTAGSTGLGLDIARRTAERSGGYLETDVSARLGGAAVTMHLGPPG
jgi:signal transduction histidine kinase